MRRTKMMGLALVVLAVCVTAVSTASASRLTLSADGAVLPEGERIELAGRENFVVSSRDIDKCRNPEYEEMEVFATLGSNAGKKGDMTSFEAGNEYEAYETVLECGSELGTAYVAWRPDGVTLSLGTKGKASMGPTSIGVLFELWKDGRFNGELACNYFTKALHGTNTASLTRQPLTVAVGGTLKRRNSPKTCARTLNASFSFPNIETYEGTVEEEI